MKQKEKTDMKSGFSRKWVFKSRSPVFFALGFLLLSNPTFAELPPEQETHIPSKAKRALVYKGPGACVEDCAESAYLMALRNGLDPVYVGPNELSGKSTPEEEANLFRDVAIWIQPGGKSRTVIANMSSQLQKALKNFVHRGGGYVGFCAGAFSATQLVGTTGVPGYNIFPGRTVLYRSRVSTTLIPINWNGKKRMIYWEGGPYIADLPVGRAKATAYYPDGSVASAKSIYGKGKIYITGLHPEAPQWWRDEAGLRDDDGLDFDLADEMISWVLNH